MLLGGLALLGAQSIEEQRRDLYETRSRLESVEKRLAELRSRRRWVERTMQEDSVKLLTLRRLAAQIEQAQREREAQIALIRQAMRRVQDQLNDRKSDLAQRLVTIYKYGRTLDLEMLFSARTLPDVYKKLFYLRMIAEADRRRMQELMQLHSELVAQQSYFKFSAASLRELQEEYERRQRELRADRAFRRAELGNIAAEEVSKQELAAQLAAAVAQIEELVQRLEEIQRQNPAAPTRSSLKVGVPWPVAGTVRTRFGELGAQGGQVRSNGIVMECNPGAPVKSIAPGRVCYAEEFMSYGNLVIVDHGLGSFSLYGSLMDIAVGVDEIVDEGSLIGHADASFYFELRRNNRPVNPLDFLR